MDDPFYAPNHRRPPAPRTTPRPCELLFAFVRESDHRTFAASSHITANCGVEAQFFENGELLIGRRFDMKAQAMR